MHISIYIIYVLSSGNGGLLSIYTLVPIYNYMYIYIHNCFS